MSDHPRLTPEEDAALRRLTFLASLGHLAEGFQGVKSELDGRDLRDRVRAPNDVVVQVHGTP